MIEVTLLKALSKKDNYNSFKILVNPKTLASESIMILKDYEVYFDKYKEDVNFDKFSTFFFTERHPFLDEKSIQDYRDILSKINKSSDAEAKDVITSFKKQEFYNSLHNKIDKNIDIRELKEEIDKFAVETASLEAKDIEIEMDLDHALDSVDRSKGLVWRCEALKNHFNGGLIKGDFGIIAAYVDAGKSSFLASELSYMAMQLTGDDYILWMSNEGAWTSILPRVYCAALNCTKYDLLTRKEEAAKKYISKMNGDKNRLRIVDIQGWSTKDIEDVLKKKPPRVLAIDLLDHVQGFDKYRNSETGTEVYNKLYQWAREVATKYCPVLGISQLNGDGEDEMFPKMSKLRGSRVDKQAAATFQLNIGSISADNTKRYLSMPKNKVNENKAWRAEVKFDAARSRFI